MSVLYAVDAGLSFAATPAHGVASAQPVPHWLVLLVAVPTLWLSIGGAVVAVDRLCDWIENSAKR